jgi:gluconate 2-dehydrogenase gamma chain
MVDDGKNHKPVSSSSRRSFLKIGTGVLAGAVVASVVGIPLAGAKPTNADALQTELNLTKSQLNTATTQVTALQGKVGSLQTQTSSLQVELDTLTAFLTLSTDEQSLVEAIAETIIPTDSNGPGAKEAGVIYFIDRQLASDYGKNGNMYRLGPFVLPGETGPITVQGITYTGGSMFSVPGQGTQYQYGMLLRDFWRYGLDAVETYCNSAYGGNFETLSSADQVQALTDLSNNKPTSFNDIIPADFFYEVFFMTWCGFLMDPLYGGNQNMVGWTLTAFNGTNQGNFYGEGLTTAELMVASTPTRLQPASLGQFQKGSP